MVRSFRFLTIALVALMLAGLASACGSKEAAPSASAPPASAAASGTASPEESAAPSASADASETRVYKDVSGREVAIPVKPQRVFALWNVGDMLALGAKPVGSTQAMLRFYNEEEKSGIEELGDGSNMEAILALTPDLIFASARTPAEQIEAYSKVAPVVVTPFFGDPFESLDIVADVLGKQAEKEAWLERYEARVAEAKEKLQPVVKPGETAIVYQYALKSIYIYRTSVFRTLYETLGFAPPERLKELQQDAAFSSEQLTEEALPDFSADRVFIVVNDEDSRDTMSSVEQGSVWKGLPAVQANQVYRLHQRISMADVYTLYWALDEIPRLMLGQS